MKINSGKLFDSILKILTSLGKLRFLKIKNKCYYHIRLVYYYFSNILSFSKDGKCDNKFTLRNPLIKISEIVLNIFDNFSEILA